MPAQNPEFDFYRATKSEAAENLDFCMLLLKLALERSEHLLNAELASQLIDGAGGDWRKAVELLKAQCEYINSNLRLLILTVALEGKEREQQPNPKE